MNVKIKCSIFLIGDAVDGAVSLRNHFKELSDIASMSCNRLSLSSKLFSSGILSWECHQDITDNSSRTDREKGQALMNGVMLHIAEHPEDMPKLISDLKGVEAFRFVALKL